MLVWHHIRLIIYYPAIEVEFMRRVTNLWHIQLRFSISIDYLHRYAITIDSVRSMCRILDSRK